MTAPTTASSFSDTPNGADAHVRRCAVICVGNKLMLDEGIGPAVYEALLEQYEIPENVSCFDVGCMSLDDFIITVDAVDGTGEPAGTVFRFSPDDVARHTGAMASLHDMKLIDLFDSAALLGYEARGICLGMQVLNMSPVEYTIGLAEPVFEALPLLVETVEAELFREGFILRKKTAEPTA